MSGLVGGLSVLPKPHPAYGPEVRDAVALLGNYIG